MSSESWSEFTAKSFNESESFSESELFSRSRAQALIPVLGKELTHVQFRSLEEQLFRTMAVLFDQKQRQGVARLVGMTAPVSIFTPEVAKTPATVERTSRFLDRCYEKLPFALPSATAQRQLAERSNSFAEELLREISDEPQQTKRKITSTSPNPLIESLGETASGKKRKIV